MLFWWAPLVCRFGDARLACCAHSHGIVLTTLQQLNRFLPARLLERNKKEPLLTKRKRKRVKTTAGKYVYWWC
jgi:hypothetical protein